MVVVMAMAAIPRTVHGPGWALTVAVVIAVATTAAVTMAIIDYHIP